MSKGVKIGIGVAVIVLAVLAILYILSGDGSALSTGPFSIGNRPGAKREDT